MPLDVGRVSHLLEQMHRSEDDAGDPIDAGMHLVTDGARGFTWEDAATAAAATTVESETTFGITPAVGTDTEYARQDHTHGSPANPVTGAVIAALGFVGPILIDDTHSTPLVFGDLLQNDDQDDLLYADVG
jgi:hypothetical protein